MAAYVQSEDNLVIHAVQLFILNGCKLSCQGCGLKNGPRDIEKVYRNLVKFLIKHSNYLDTREVGINIESAGIFMHDEFIENHLEKLLKIFKTYNIYSMETFDYHDHFFKSKYKDYVIDLLEKYNVKLYILSPTHTGENYFPYKKVKIVPAQLMAKRYENYSPTEKKVDIFNFKDADLSTIVGDKSIEADRREIYHHVLEKYRYQSTICNTEMATDLRGNEVSCLIDDSDHGMYITPAFFNFAKFLMAIPLNDVRKDYEKLKKMYPEYYNLVKELT